jgi:hypothetical protein
MEDEGNFGSTSQQSDNKTSQSQKKEKDKESSLLYNLSKFKTFSLFKKVVLVSCPKDQYVPFYSARIQVWEYLFFIFIYFVFVGCRLTSSLFFLCSFFFI